MRIRVPPASPRQPAAPGRRWVKILVGVHLREYGARGQHVRLHVQAGMREDDGAFAARAAGVPGRPRATAMT